MRWILVAVLIGGLVVVLVAVPIGGRTALDRILGRPAESSEKAAGQTEAKPATGATDRLTVEDRQKLDRLIESKLGEKNEKGGEAELPRKK